MQKINFENATLTQQAKVTIGDTSYEITPAVYSGGTDLNAETLNYAFQLMHPVGSIYMTTVETNPEDIFGFGTWQLWGAGKVPVCIDANDNDFNTVEKTGGEKEHTLTIEEMPSHSHKLNGNTNVVFDENSIYPYLLASAKRGYADGSSVTFGGDYTINDTTTKGGGQSHNNLQPYITCYMFKRIA